MNIRIGREAAVLLLVFGLIMIANPNMWWLMFIIGPMITNSMRSQESAEQRQARQREREERRAAQVRRDEPNWSNRRRRTVADEMRRQRTASRARSTNNGSRVYENPTLGRSGNNGTRIYENPAASAGPLSHAIEAVAAAGHAPEDLALLPVDIGFLAYTSGSRPVVHREAPIPDTVDYIQPYIELALERPAAGTLRFEIVDSEGEIRYVREERRQLKAGRTPVIPETRMPVGDFLYTDDSWSLRVYAANTLIAEHHFGWIDPDIAPALREHLAEDGELSADLEVLVEQASLQPMSLDELLGEDAPPARAAGRRG
jgi:hypothetical protein